jgi:hypothetical protein
MINFQTPPTKNTERIFVQENDSYSNLQKLKADVTNRKVKVEDLQKLQNELSRLEYQMKSLTAEKVSNFTFEFIKEKPENKENYLDEF